MKTIWIVNYYAASPATTGNHRHFEFAKHLTAAGYRVRVFSAGFLFTKGIDLVPKDQKYYNTEYDGIPYTHIKVMHYGGNGIKRMLSITQFALRVFFLRAHFKKPDIILHNIHAPFDYPVLWCASCIKTKYIAEAWDLWPHVFVTFKLVSAMNPLLKIAYHFEKKMYEKASDVIFSFEGGLDYLHERKWTSETGGRIIPDRVHYINNGINLKEFYENIIRYPSSDPDLNAKDKFKVVYMGSIRLVNNLKQLIDAAALLKDETRFLFLIYGNGADKTFLQNYCIDNHIDNVVFKNDWIPSCEVPYVVSKASLNIMNYKRKFGQYGVSSGKMFQYFAAGKPILCNIKINYSDIERHNLGLDTDLDTPEQYADAIRFFANMDSDSYNAMCERVKETAKEFDFDVLSERLIKIIDNC
ncbi:MAG: glycosyltransferase family 4 protein [Bacteroidales bacterium]|nr:glycosyltransferase family 4 protein [Bacteroidales bacterium]